MFFDFDHIHTHCLVTKRGSIHSYTAINFFFFGGGDFEIQILYQITLHDLLFINTSAHV